MPATAAPIAALRAVIFPAVRLIGEPRRVARRPVETPQAPDGDEVERAEEYAEPMRRLQPRRGAPRRREDDEQPPRRGRVDDREEGSQARAGRGGQ